MLGLRISSNSFGKRKSSGNNTQSEPPLQNENSTTEEDKTMPSVTTPTSPRQSQLRDSAVSSPVDMKNKQDGIVPLHMAAHVPRLVSSPMPTLLHGINGAPSSGNKNHTRYGSQHSQTSLHETVQAIRQKCTHELGVAKASQYVMDIGFDDLVHFIQSERLIGVPHPGSGWDHVLTTANHFAEQIQVLETTVGAFAQHSDSVALIAYGHLQLLLELGQENAHALEKSFSVFDKLSISLSLLLKGLKRFPPGGEVREELVLAFGELVSLIASTATYYHKTVSQMETSSTVIDFFGTFGHIVESFEHRKRDIVELMWAQQIHGGSLATLVDWLSPQDSVLRSLLEDSYAGVDSDAACAWFDTDLKSFIRTDKKMLFIHGSAGTGKTVLASWVMQRLQRPINTKLRSSILCRITRKGPIRDNSMSIIRGLLYKLLEQRLGDTYLYRALANAQQRAEQGDDLAKQEDALWHIFSDSVCRKPSESTPAEELVAIVDGIDVTKHRSIIDRLSAIAKRSSYFRIIVISRQPSPQLESTQNFKLTPDHLQVVVQHIAYTAIQHLKFLDSHEKRHKAQERIVSSANGNLLWTKLFCKLIAQETTEPSFEKTLASPPKAIPDLVQRLLLTQTLPQDAKDILTLLSSAERPLTLVEVQLLLQVDVQRRVLKEHKPDLTTIFRSLDPLIVVTGKLVDFRHDSLIDTIRDMAPKLGLDVKSDQPNYLTRLLVYSKQVLSEGYVPSLDPIDGTLVQELFHSYPLLEYTIRYWPVHFKHVVPSTNNFNPSPEFKSIFPGSTLLPALELPCWSRSHPPTETKSLLDMAAVVRRQIFGTDQPQVLQSYVNCAKYHQLISSPEQYIKWFVLSLRTARSVLGIHHPITTTCATIVIDTTSTMTFTSRTELVTYREEVLQILITIHTEQHGSSSETVIKLQSALAELYTSIHEEDKAETIYRIIYRTTVDRHGKHSVEAERLSQHLDVRLRKSYGNGEIETYKDFLSEEEESLDIDQSFTIGRVHAILDIIKSAEAKGETSFTEETYAELWLRVIEACRTSVNMEWQEVRFDVALSYFHSLTRHKKDAEARMILVALWQEYELSSTNLSEAVVVRLVEVARLMKSVKLSTLAFACYKVVASYYRSVHKEDTAVYKEVSAEIRSLTTVITDMMTTSSTSTTTVSENILLEIWQSSLETTNIVDVKVAMQLSLHYTREERWAEAVSVLTSALTAKSFFSSSEFSSENVSIIIDLADNLATCYKQLYETEKLEEVYVRLFTIVKKVYKVDHAIFVRTMTQLINFYEEHRQSSKLISLYQDLLVLHRQAYGEAHEITISTIYRLGRLCRLHPRTHGYFIDYYLQILTILKVAVGNCQHSALEALLTVCAYTFEDMRYAESARWYSVAWSVFLSKHAEYREFKDVELVQLLFDNYLACLTATSTDISVLHQVATEYRSICTKSTSLTSLIVKSTLTLARVCRRSKQYHAEAIALYEDLLKTSSAQFSAEEHKQIKQSLTSLYREQMATTSSSSSNVSESAVSILIGRFVETRDSSGYTHETTLSQLRELIAVYQKQKKTESAIKELKTAITSILLTNTTTSVKQLIETARSIALIVTSCEMTQTFRQVIVEIQRQIIFKHKGSVSKVGFDVTKCGHSSLVFVASLEYHLRDDMAVTFSEVLSTLMSMSILYEHFQQSITSKASLEVVFAATARIRYFLVSRRRLDLADGIIDSQAVDYFLQVESKLNVSRSAATAFLLVVVDHLGPRYSLGKRSTSYTLNKIMRWANKACVDRVGVLISHQQYPAAIDLATCTFRFLHAHRVYNQAGDIALAFKLATYMAGRNLKINDEKLKPQMLDLSRHLIDEVLRICEQEKIDLVDEMAGEV